MRRITALTSAGDGQAPSSPCLLLTNRSLLGRKCLDIENEIRGALKIFGLKVGPVTKGTFERRVRELVDGDRHLEAAFAPMLRARAVLLEEFNHLHRMVLDAVRGDEICRRFLTVPGVGPITALAFKTAVEVPERFAKSKTVGAHFGLTPRRYSSGQIDYQGHISKCGDALVRTALYEAGSALLTRVKRPSALKAWSLRTASAARCGRSEGQTRAGGSRHGDNCREYGPVRRSAAPRRVA
jgi:transposase